MTDRPLRIVVFSPDIPYPPDKGHRADIWRRLVAMQRTGCEIFLVFFQGDVPASLSGNEVAIDIAEVCVESRRFRIEHTLPSILSRFWMLWRNGVPWHAACRTLNVRQFDLLKRDLKLFHPDLVWVEGPWCGVTAQCIAAGLQIPMFYRSHNIEFQYMAKQALAARKIRDRIAWKIACVGLQNFETDVIKASRQAFDISMEDIKYWRSIGIGNVQCLPSLPESSLREHSDFASARCRDVVFLGNLQTPNNIRGVEFLVNEVVPRVQLARRRVDFVVAGSNPGTHVRAVIAAQPAVTLLENVKDAVEIMRSAKVLVNPVRTGSGVMIKMLDMLMTDASVVTSNQGLAGLPAEVRDTVRVADDAESFARAIVEELEKPTVDMAAREKARSHFSVQAIERLVSELRTMIAS